MSRYVSVLRGDPKTKRLTLVHKPAESWYGPAEYGEFAFDNEDWMQDITEMRRSGDMEGLHKQNVCGETGLRCPYCASEEHEADRED